jgi:hypothetical protein
VGLFKRLQQLDALVGEFLFERPGREALVRDEQDALACGDQACVDLQHGGQHLALAELRGRDRPHHQPAGDRSHPMP